MNTFDKNNWDVSKIFVAYLAFLGNPTKVGIALDMQPEVVQVLAAAEDWEAKLKVYLGMRQKGPLAEPDASIRRTATYIIASHLKEIIERLIDRYYRLADDNSIMEFLSPPNPRTNLPRFNPRILFDLTRALDLATRIIDRETIANDDPEEPKQKQRVTIRAALAKTSAGMDTLPGLTPSR